MPVTELEINTRRQSGLEDITDRVQQAVSTSGIEEGLCVVFVPHTTAGLVINENNDPTVQDDLLSTLERLVPREGPYRHREGNAAAHIKTTLVGSSHTLMVQGGQLLLGTWQGIFLAEFDGPRRRSVIVSVQPSAISVRPGSP